MLESGVLEQVDPPVSEAEAGQLAAEVFGIAGRAARLTGERDQNFRLDRPDGSRLLLKISNSAEDPAVTDLQSQALLHIARKAPGLPTPRIHPALDGAPQHVWRRRGGAACQVRMLSFLAGVPLHEAKLTPGLLGEIGQVLARFDAALEDFRHPAEDYDLLWDVQHASRLTELTWAIEDAATRRLAETGLAVFSERAAPRLPQLPAQLIHNDLNPHNVLVSETQPHEVTGIIDLGDMVRAPRIDDLAVAAAYHVGFGDHPLDGVVALARGYGSVLPLEEGEIAVLAPLIIGRLAMSVTISSWRAQKDPANRPYIFRNLPAALRGLEMLLPLEAEAAIDKLWSARGAAGR